MKCDNCGSEWKIGQRITVPLVTCPFCQKNLPHNSGSQKTKFFEDSKLALSFIANEHGIDELLSRKVVSSFADIAPTLKEEKDLIKIMQEKGALEVLKSAMQSSVTEQQLAVQRAAAKLPAFMDATVIISMLYEFTEALGWQLYLPEPPREPQAVVTETVIKKSPAIGSNYSFAGYDWRVLDVQRDKMLILSKKIIKKRSYHERRENTTWAQCTLRSYLNGAFYDLLGQNGSRIIETKITTNNNLWYGTKGGDATNDKIFLLSIEEVLAYLGDKSGDYENRRRKEWNNGNPVLSSDGWLISNQYNSERKANDDTDTASWWWLRSPGHYSSLAASVYSDGGLGIGCDFGVSVSGGVRPALWLNL